MCAKLQEKLCYCHADLNSFYASVEMLYNSHYRKVPFAVTGNPTLRHGIVLAKNDIAKDMGVKTGHVLMQVLQRIPNLEYKVARHKVYDRFSESFRKVLLTVSPWVQPFGPDEASVWTSEDITDTAREICRQVDKELGLNVSIGVSFNRAFAKLASDEAKRNSIMVISRENYKQTAWPLPAMNMLGVGRKTAIALSRIGVLTIGDLANTSREVLYKMFGKNGVVMHLFANGLDPTKIAEYGTRDDKKSIGHSSTTPYDLTDAEQVHTTFMIMGTSIGKQLRKKNLFARTITISTRDTDMSTQIWQTTIKKPTQIGREIADIGLELFRRRYDFRMRKPIRTIDLRVTNLSRLRGYEQISLFDDEGGRLIRLEKLEKTFDLLDERYGHHTVVPAKLLLYPELSAYSPEDNPHPFG